MNLHTLALAVLSACSLPAAAPVLVELFTSQGCNSCPPADRLLAKLAQEPGVIVLSEHVDYWNYLGWRDPYSDALFSRRQSDYSRRLGRDGVYTPQMVIDGQWEALGSDEAAVRRVIARAAQREKSAVEIAQARRDGRRVTVTVQAPGSAAALWIALAEESAAADVSRGENAGHRLTHAAVVRVLKPARAGQPVELELPAGAGQQGLRVVALLQDAAGRIVGVAQVKLL